MDSFPSHKSGFLKMSPSAVLHNTMAKKGTVLCKLDQKNMNLLSKVYLNSCK